MSWCARHGPLSLSRFLSLAHTHSLSLIAHHGCGVSQGRDTAHFELSLDALSLRSDLISSKQILSVVGLAGADPCAKNDMNIQPYLLAQDQDFWETGQVPNRNFGLIKIDF